MCSVPVEQTLAFPGLRRSGGSSQRSLQALAQSRQYLIIFYASYIGLCLSQSSICGLTAIRASMLTHKRDGTVYILYKFVLKVRNSLLICQNWPILTSLLRFSILFTLFCLCQPGLSGRLLTLFWPLLAYGIGNGVYTVFHLYMVEFDKRSKTAWP